MRRFRRQALVAAAGGLAIASISACAGLNAKPEPVDLRKWPEIRTDARAEVLKARVRDYAVTFAAEVDLAAMSIERRAVDPDVRRRALLWRLRADPGDAQGVFPSPAPGRPDRRVDADPSDGGSVFQGRRREGLRSVPERSHRRLTPARVSRPGHQRLHYRISRRDRPARARSDRSLADRAPLAGRRIRACVSDGALCGICARPRRRVPGCRRPGGDAARPLATDCGPI